MLNWTNISSDAWLTTTWRTMFEWYDLYNSKYTLLYVNHSKHWFTQHYVTTKYSFLNSKINSNSESRNNDEVTYGAEGWHKILKHVKIIEISEIKIWVCLLHSMTISKWHSKFWVQILKLPLFHEGSDSLLYT